MSGVVPYKEWTAFAERVRGDGEDNVKICTALGLVTPDGRPKYGGSDMAYWAYNNRIDRDLAEWLTTHQVVSMVLLPHGSGPILFTIPWEEVQRRVIA